MRYVLVEDLKDGKVICDLINTIYARDKDGVCVESTGGIGNLEAKVRELDKILCKEDSIIIVYDDIIENPIVAGCVKRAKRYIESESANREQYKFISTVSFELEILMIDDIEYFTDMKKYYTYVSDIRDIFRLYRDTGICTEYTKNVEKYSGFYNKIRKGKRDKWIYKNLSDEEFELCITIESLSKELIKEVFRSQPIDRPMTACWRNACCEGRINRCKLELIDTAKIESAQKENNDKYVKANILISNTSYKKLAEHLSNGSGQKEILHYNISDFFIDNIDGVLNVFQ